DTPELRAFSWPNLRALFSQFNQAHYAPVMLVSLAVDYRLGGLDPLGYHLTNLALHAACVALFYVFVRTVLPTAAAALFAAAVFAVHPIQLEAVSVAIQRKTVLSGVLFFATLLAWRRWCTARRPTAYAVAIAAFVLAGLTKPSVAPLPLVLLLIGSVCWRR